jgi:predicted O-methyltransferase YrrM
MYLKLLKEFKMKPRIKFSLMIFSFLLFISLLVNPIHSQELKDKPELDKKVKGFLDSHKNQWHDMNVPATDGKLLYDIIIKNKYKNALEIGTSTGHSAIWISWALSKTDGKLITIEINKRRHKEALDNFKEAGLSDYIDARLADAHELVRELKGPFDFVFCDADKDWYKNYFIALEPKLKVGGCYTAHNVPRRKHGYMYGWFRGTQGFLDYVESLPNFETTIDTLGAGVSISYKK